MLITANKRIRIISAYFLAAASGKRMRLLTSLYGNILYLVRELYLGDRIGSFSLLER